MLGRTTWGRTRHIIHGPGKILLYLPLFHLSWFLRTEVSWRDPSTTLTHRTQPRGFDIHSLVSSPALFLLSKYRHNQLCSSHVPSARFSAPPQQSGPILAAAEGHLFQAHTVPGNKPRYHLGECWVVQTHAVSWADRRCGQLQENTPALTAAMSISLVHMRPFGRLRRQEGLQDSAVTALAWAHPASCRGQILLCLALLCRPDRPKQSPAEPCSEEPWLTWWLPDTALATVFKMMYVKARQQNIPISENPVRE